jgi:transcriptional regulator with XRE-family HTH domain
MIKSLADRIKIARERLGLSQSQLARIAGVTPAAIGNYEQGTTKTVRNLVDVATALKVRPEWLANGTGPMEAPTARVSAESLELARQIEQLSTPQRTMVKAMIIGLAHPVDDERVREFYPPAPPPPTAKRR